MLPVGLGSGGTDEASTKVRHTRAGFRRARVKRRTWVPEESASLHNMERVADARAKGSGGARAILTPHLQQHADTPVATGNEASDAQAGRRWHIG